jgi:tight adherence protein B
MRAEDFGKTGHETAVELDADQATHARMEAIRRKAGALMGMGDARVSAFVRARKMMGEKIKALSSEATASAGIIGSLPPAVMILVSVTTPAYMAKLFTDPRGQFMLRSPCR